jgi:hypothetical protein
VGRLSPAVRSRKREALARLRKMGDFRCRTLCLFEYHIQLALAPQVMWAIELVTGV